MDMQEFISIRRIIMAELCRECFLEMYDADLKKKKIIVSKEPDLCENCGMMKNVVVKITYKNPITRVITRIHKFL